jgi:hypothetical protein
MNRAWPLRLPGSRRGGILERERRAGLVPKRLRAGDGKDGAEPPSATDRACATARGSRSGAGSSVRMSCTRTRSGRSWSRRCCAASRCVRRRLRSTSDSTGQLSRSRPSRGSACGSASRRASGGGPVRATPRRARRRFLLARRDLAEAPRRTRRRPKRARRRDDCARGLHGPARPAARLTGERPARPANGPDQPLLRRSSELR